MRLLTNYGAVAVFLSAFSGNVWGQAALSLSGGSGVAGVPTVLNLSLSNSAAAPAGVQWTLTWPSDRVSGVSIAPGPAATGAGKSVSCTPGAGSSTCVLSGAGAASVGSGVVAYVTVTPTYGDAPVAVAQAYAADPAGGAMDVAASAGGLSSATSSGSVMPGVPSAGLASLYTMSCSPQTLNGGGTATCTVTLTAPAPDGGALVNLITGSWSLSVPATVLVPAGATAASVTVLTLPTAITQDAGLTAAYNGNSSSFSWTLLP